MRYRITTPEAGYSGQVGAIRFDNGVAEVAGDAQELAYFRQAGYGVEEIDDPAAGPSAPEPPSEPAPPEPAPAEPVKATKAAAKKAAPAATEGGDQ